MVNGKTKATDYLVGEAAARAGGFAANTSAALDVIKTLAQQYEIVIAIRTSKSFSAIKDPDRAPKSKDVQDKSSNWGPQSGFMPDDQNVLGRLDDSDEIDGMKIQESNPENKLSAPKAPKKRRNSVPLLQTPSDLHDGIIEKQYNVLELREDGTMLFEVNPKYRPRRASAIFAANIPENATLDQEIPIFYAETPNESFNPLLVAANKENKPYGSDIDLLWITGPSPEKCLALGISEELAEKVMTQAFDTSKPRELRALLQTHRKLITEEVQQHLLGLNENFNTNLSNTSMKMIMNEISKLPKDKFLSRQGVVTAWDFFIMNKINQGIQCAFKTNEFAIQHGADNNKPIEPTAWPDHQLLHVIGTPGVVENIVLTNSQEQIDYVRENLYPAHHYIKEHDKWHEAHQQQLEQKQIQEQQERQFRSRMQHASPHHQSIRDIAKKNSKPSISSANQTTQNKPETKSEIRLGK